MDSHTRPNPEQLLPGTRRGGEESLGALTQERRKR
jgi:hypothetical protein